jgi:NOL1/NOP2/fmu family ribosome biogenesis protein
VFVESCARRQAALIEQAARLVRPGGWLLYTTCTFSPEENEGVIAGFLKAHPEFELREISQQGGFAGGYSEWSYGATPVKAGIDMQRAVRLWPQRVRGEGHFLTLLQRDGGEQPSPPRRAPAPPLASEARRLLEQFTRSSLSGWSGEGQVIQQGAYLYRLPAQGTDLRGLHVIHPGLWLGTLKKNRFEPSQALAMSLKSEQARRAVRLDEGKALDYLQGKTLPALGPETGWALITINDFPLGWGKCSQGSVKNYYPRGLRWS